MISSRRWLFVLPYLLSFHANAWLPCMPFCDTCGSPLAVSFGANVAVGLNGIVASNQKLSSSFQMYQTSLTQGFTDLSSNDMSNSQEYVTGLDASTKAWRASLQVVQKSFEAFAETYGLSLYQAFNDSHQAYSTNMYQLQFSPTYTNYDFSSNLDMKTAYDDHQGVSTRYVTSCRQVGVALATDEYKYNNALQIYDKVNSSNKFNYFLGEPEQAHRDTEKYSYIIGFSTQFGSHSKKIIADIHSDLLANARYYEQQTLIDFTTTYDGKHFVRFGDLFKNKAAVEFTQRSELELWMYNSERGMLLENVMKRQLYLSQLFELLRLKQQRAKILAAQVIEASSKNGS